MANVPRLSKILRGKDTKPQTELEAAIKYAIDNAGGGGGSDLPPAGTAGNVLTSTGDGWESAEPPAATELLCTISVGESVTCDVAVADIIAALEANRPVVGMIAGLSRFPVKIYNADINKVVFLYETINGDAATYVEFVGESGDPDQWSYSPTEKKYLPSVTASNNGQLLGVSGGAWAAVDNKAPLIVHGTIDMVNGTAEITDDITIADIIAAYVADRAVFFQAALGEGYYVRLGLFQINGTELTFSVSDIGSGDVASIYTCEFDNSKTGTFNHVP